MKPVFVMGIIITTLIALTIWKHQSNLQNKYALPNSHAMHPKHWSQNIQSQQQAPKKKPVVIILNGPSASGKSSIQKEFQNLMMPDLWIKLGIDNLFDSPMPEITAQNLEYWQNENQIRWVTTTKDAQSNPTITLHVGAEGNQVAYGMNSAITAYAQNGCSVIVDYIAYEKAWIDDLQAKLAAANVVVYWIKVALPLPILEEREAARATSPKGHGRSHYNNVYHDVLYDLELDTSKLSSKDCAQKILTMLYKKSNK